MSEWRDVVFNTTSVLHLCQYFFCLYFKTLACPSVHRGKGRRSCHCGAMTQWLWRNDGCEVIFKGYANAKKFQKIRTTCWSKLLYIKKLYCCSLNVLNSLHILFYMLYRYIYFWHRTHGVFDAINIKGKMFAFCLLGNSNGHTKTNGVLKKKKQFNPTF